MYKYTLVVNLKLKRIVFIEILVAFNASVLLVLYSFDINVTLGLMKKIKILVPIVFGVLIASCSKDVSTEPSESDYLIFGHFYGFCQGEKCIEIFKLESNRLLEDSKDEYPSRTDFYNGDYIALGNTKFDLVKNLMDYFPDNLLNENDTVFGCPDCADQGGLYIEYNFNGIRKFWIIDQSKGSVPIYLHDFMDKANEKIDLINN